MDLNIDDIEFIKIRPGQEVYRITVKALHIPTNKAVYFTEKSYIVAREKCINELREQIKFL